VSQALSVEKSLCICSLCRQALSYDALIRQQTYGRNVFFRSNTIWCPGCFFAGIFKHAHVSADINRSHRPCSL